MDYPGIQMFLPTTKDECAALGWTALDVILVTGDAYVDSSFFGAALIGKYLVSKGYSVGIIPQPSQDGSDIARLGEPRLFWGITAGCVDSMVSNYTPLRKKRNQDDLTPGGINNRRPDRATIIYANMIRAAFGKTVPIVLGGIEASLRRIAHYDFWDNKVRRSVLIDAKADILVYGMGERTIEEIAFCLRRGEDWREVRGICYADKNLPDTCVLLPSYEETAKSHAAFIRMFRTFYENNDPVTARSLAQKYGDRYLIQNVPQLPLTSDELDEVYDLEFEREAHPSHEEEGEVKALETVRFSLTTHRGCYGECNFCAITVHQGRTVVSRSEESILREVDALTRHPKFKGIIFDLGGPTANMYGFECEKKTHNGSCLGKRCLHPTVCKSLRVRHDRQLTLFKKVREFPGVKKVFVASGVRYDLVFADPNGERYIEEFVAHHISGQMKIAPEHTSAEVLRLMGKPPRSLLVRFKKLFDAMNAQCGKKQFLTYYFIAAHPGSTIDDMRALSSFSRSELRHRPEQVQIFTPTPSTFSTLIYYTGVDPFSGLPVFVERDLKGKARQKDEVRGTVRHPRRR
jgi:uncharacterized radical SAM protein YgiQ